MRLLVAETPEGREFWKSGEPCVLRHDRRGFRRTDKENVERQGGIFANREEFRCAAGEIECSERLMHKHGPAGGADQPGDWDAAAMRGKAVTPLAPAHGGASPPTSKWHPTLPH